MGDNPVCYKVLTHRAFSREVVSTQVPCHEGGKPRKGYFATKEEAEAAWLAQKAAVASEYKKLEPTAMALLEEKEAYLLEVFTSLGVEVSTDASAWDDSGLDSWLCLSTTVKGEEGTHYYELKVQGYD